MVDSEFYKDIAKFAWVNNELIFAPSGDALGFEEWLNCANEDIYCGFIGYHRVQLFSMKGLSQINTNNISYKDFDTLKVRYRIMYPLDKTVTVFNGCKTDSFDGILEPALKVGDFR